MAIFARKRDHPPGVGPRRQSLSAPQRLPLLLALSGLAALSLRRASRGASDWDGDAVGEGDASFRRALRTCHGGDVLGDTELLAIPADGAWDSLSGAHHAGTDAAAGVDLGVAFPLAQRLNADRPFPHFTLQDAAGVARMYRSGFALLVYDPVDDAFQTLYFKEHVEAPSRHAKLMKTVPLLANMLRTTFPERFQGETSDELVIPISAGDDPGVKYGCLDNLRHPDEDPFSPQQWHDAAASRPDCAHDAPVLQFGAVYRDEHIFPDMLDLPMSGNGGFLECLYTWAKKGRVCWDWRPVPDPALWDSKKKSVEKGEKPKVTGLVYGKEFKLEWENLIPQVVWRGTDYPFIHGLNPKLTRPKRRLSEETKVDEKQLRHDREAAVVSMREQYNQLLPRWQAVVLTAEAEVQAQARSHSLLHPFDHRDTPPWANMKFAGKHTKGADYKEWEILGFVTGEPMDLPALAKFRYQIDLGGAGGTDLAGTLQKLALPGLLFHHMTATKDFLHDWMTPWVHYVPVASDLSDLKDKLAWAESHQDRAKQISDAGTKLVRYLTGPEGLKDMFERAMLAPLRSAVAAYQPLATELLDHKGGGSWAEVIEHMEGKGAVFPVLTCTGISTDSCAQVEVQKEKKQGKKTKKKRKKKR